MKWLLVVSSLTGFTEPEREVTFYEVESRAACEALAERMEIVFAEQFAKLQAVYDEITK